MDVRRSAYARTAVTSNVAPHSVAPLTRIPARHAGHWPPLQPRREVEAHMKEFEIAPAPDDPRLSETVTGLDHEGREIETAVVTERPLTLFLNAREIVTMMTIGDHPDL